MPLTSEQMVAATAAQRLIADDALTGLLNRIVSDAAEKAVFLDERDRDEVCREFGVDREYLRVLLFRAKQEFKTEYLKRIGGGLTAKKA